MQEVIAIISSNSWDRDRYTSYTCPSLNAAKKKHQLRSKQSNYNPEFFYFENVFEITLLSIEVRSQGGLLVSQFPLTIDWKHTGKQQAKTKALVNLPINLVEHAIRNYNIKAFSTDVTQPLLFVDGFVLQLKFRIEPPGSNIINYNYTTKNTSPLKHADLNALTLEAKWL